jgi:hypothetical protein
MTLDLDENLIPPKEARILCCKGKWNVLFDGVYEVQQKGIVDILMNNFKSYTFDLLMRWNMKYA